MGPICLLVENWLRLTAEACLLLVVTTLSLSHDGGFTCFVLGDLMWAVLLAPAAICVACLWNVDHCSRAAKSKTI